MNSRNFPQVGSEFLRGAGANAVDTGHIPPPVTGKETKGGLRGVERNTARGVKEAVTIQGITEITYGANTDAPEVVKFRTWGEL